MSVPIMRRHHQFDDDGVYDDEDLLLEEQTEQDEPVETASVPPLRTVVVDTVVTEPVVPQHVQTFTVVLTSDDPIQQLLPSDPLRQVARVIAIDHDVVMCHSFVQASDPANQVSTLLRPSGAVLSNSAGAPSVMELTSTAQMYVVGNTFPSRVAVVVERRG